MYSGSIGLEGRAIQPKSPAQALALGFAMVPEDRKMQGILPNISVRGNITVSMLKKLVSPIGFVMTDKEEQIAQRAVSYTHLDVYKRQVLIHPGAMAFTLIPRLPHSLAIRRVIPITADLLAV